LGGTAGVGLESAAQFAENGARVVLLGRNAQRGAAACEQVRVRVPEAWVSFVGVDARDVVDVARAERECCDRLCAIDVLMCTTGPSQPPRLLRDIAAAKVTTPGETLIGAVMAAIVMFSKAAALEVKREGVRINVLTPSLIANTPGAALIARDPFSAKMFEKAAGMAHLGVAGTLRPGRNGRVPGQSGRAANHRSDDQHKWRHLGRVVVRAR
jgi:NAD(P)-dependent dehydrogenase (short-subunit alcohol dehydrogenase family)